MALPEGALAQNAVLEPIYVNPGTATDIGNGPQDIRVTQGNALLATSRAPASQYVGFRPPASR